MRDKPVRIPVLGSDGLLGYIDPSGPVQDDQRRIVLNDGRAVLVPARFLEGQEDGSYYISLNRAQLNLPVNQMGEDEVVIPVIEETAEVSRKRLEKGRVKVTKEIHEREELVDEPTLSEEVEIERVPVNRSVDQAPEVRYEGDTVIIPVLEEVLVVEKRLVLKEEVRVTRRRKSNRNPQRVKLRLEEVKVERRHSSED